MDNRERKFELVGFINPYCVLPAFVYPLFRCSGQYYYEDGTGYRISNFISADENLLQNKFLPIEDAKHYSLGDETVYAYQTQKDHVIYGNGKIMYTWLTREFAKETNELLIREMKNISTRIIGDILKDNQLARVKDGCMEVGIRKIDRRVLASNNKDGTITIEPIKALARRCEASRTNIDLQHFTDLTQRYSKLLDEFYVLYECLVKTRQPSLEGSFLYDVDFCDRFIQILVLQSEVNLREKDILTIYQRLNFKNKKYLASQKRLRNEKTLRLAIRRLNRETEKQRKINVLFCQMLNSFPLDSREDKAQLDIKYLEGL